MPTTVDEYREKLFAWQWRYAGGHAVEKDRSTRRTPRPLALPSFAGASAGPTSFCAPMTTS